MFFNEVRQRNLYFPVGLRSCEFIAFSQVVVLSETECTENDLQDLNIFKCCSSNPSSVFHPELPVIPKPGEFNRLFIWKKTAHETQRKANNNLHFLLDSMLFRLRLNFDFNTSYKLVFDSLSEKLSWVDTSVNADNILHFSENQEIARFAVWIIRFIHFCHCRYH